MNKCVFPGTFNPFTLGHRHLVDLALKRYDRVIVAVAEETYKPGVLAAEIRAELARKTLADCAGIEVKYFQGMLTDFLSAEKCFDVVRGIRNEADAKYEKELERIYTSMDKRVNLILFPSDKKDISAERVRRAAMLGENLRGLVDDRIIGDVQKYYAK